MFQVKCFQLAALAIFAISLSILFTFKSKHPNTGLNATELIQAHNYKYEVHHIQTKDNYILTHFRIPVGRNNVKSKNIPVLIMHGLLNSAAEFVFAGPEKSLAFILADQGYDVWLGNSRGTTYSRNHTNLNPDSDAEFWNFSLHEVSVYDTPASIDYILNATNSSALHYIGFSQGVYEILTFLSENPEYSQKIRLISAMAPSIFCFNIKSTAIQGIVHSWNVINAGLSYFNTHEVGAKNGLVGKMMHFLCQENSILMKICLLHIQIFQGGTELVDMSLLPVFMGNLPAGVSTKHMIHVLQIGAAGVPQRYDYGKERNLKVYGSETPPQYSFKSITAPIALYYSKSDGLVNFKNIKLLNEILPNIVKNYLVPYEQFYHMDFVAGKNASDLVYNELIEEMEKF